MREAEPCPECAPVDRRDFLRLAGVGAGALLAAPAAAKGLTVPPAAKEAAPAEALVKELFAGMTADQKKLAQLPWDHEARHRMYNKALGKKIGEVYTKPQTELVERILKAMSSGDEGFRQFSRGGTWDASKKFTECGANIFGDPEKGKYAFVFSGHHITLRCDGDSEDGPAFGGPIYYGHTPDGYSNQNIFRYQTKAVEKFFDALDGKQRKRAVIDMGKPGEHEESVSFKAAKKRERPGLAAADLSADQMKLVEEVMRTILSPYRQADVDEVMAIIKATGGMAKINTAFYTEENESHSTSKEEPWSFWRLEGPGFIWNFRVLPHVHTYVNINKLA